MINFPIHKSNLIDLIEPIKTSDLYANIDSGDISLDDAINFYITGMYKNIIKFNVNNVEGRIEPLNDLLKLRKFNIVVTIENIDTKQFIYYKGCKFDKKELISSFASYDYKDDLVFAETLFNYDDIEYLKSEAEYTQYVRKNKIERIL